MQWILGSFDFSQNDFEMRLKKNQIKEGPLIDSVCYCLNMVKAASYYHYQAATCIG